MKLSGIFKSKLRRRIEAKIESLVIECASVMYEKQRTNIHRDTSKYCNLSVKEGRLNEQIELLRSLLE